MRGGEDRYREERSGGEKKRRSVEKRKNLRATKSDFRERHPAKTAREKK